MSSRAKNGASIARCTPEPTRLNENTASTIPSIVASSRVKLPRRKTASAAGFASTAMNAVSGSDNSNMILTPRRVVRRISSCRPFAVAEVRRGTIAITTERNSTEPPMAEISRYA